MFHIICRANILFVISLLFLLSSCGGGDGDISGGGDADISSSPSFILPDTGQTSCYDELGAVISCSGTGQDGDYSINPPSFADNGDGTVTDNVTGLIWQQIDNDNTYAWVEALSYCVNLSLGSDPDAIWRLPSRRELFSIVDFKYTVPAIDSAVFPYTNSGFYWSSSTNGTDPTKAGTVYFMGFTGSNNNKADAYYVRCVQ